MSCCKNSGKCNQKHLSLIFWAGGFLFCGHLSTVNESIFQQQSNKYIQQFQRLPEIIFMGYKNIERVLFFSYIYIYISANK